MSGIPANLETHLKSGLTTVCRCWQVTRADGKVMGFTDHDQDLSFKGSAFRADSGLSASALAQSTGLSVDNAEAVGALNSTAISEADIEAGRFDGATVEVFLVNWQNTDERWLQFRGTIGEIHRAGGAFTAELRGLTEGLNQPQGRIFQKPCTAVLGDANCKFNTTNAAFRTDIAVDVVDGGRVFTWPVLNGFAQDWFSRGRLDVLSGTAQGLWGSVKSDRILPEGRVVELWEPLGAGIAAGDTIRLTAGCDRRFATCREKFNNQLNFQGFPDLPGEDWMMAVPKKAGINSGGSRR